MVSHKPRHSIEVQILFEMVYLKGVLKSSENDPFCKRNVMESQQKIKNFSLDTFL